MPDIINHRLNGEYVSEIWNELPAGIISKNATGIGATHLELSEQCQRNSIVVSPLVSILKSKESPEKILTFYGAVDDKKAALEDYLNLGNNYLKIHVTAESLPSLFRVLTEAGIDAFDGSFHYVLDEYDLMQLQADFRESLPFAFDYYKLFAPSKRTCVSATHSKFSDPELESEVHHNVQLSSRPTRNIILCMTDNTIEAVKNLLKNIGEGQIFIFVDSIAWINTLIDQLQHTNIAIYCSSDSAEKVKYYTGYELSPTKTICFFTSAYFVGCDFKLENRPTIVTVTDPLTTMRGLSKAQIFQIGGRVRTGVDKDIIVSSCSKMFRKPRLNLVEIIKEAEKDKKYWSAKLRLTANIKKQREVIRHLNKIENIYIRLNYREEIVIHYSYIDSKMTQARDFNELYFSNDSIYNFLRNELKYRVTPAHTNYGSAAKLLKEDKSKAGTSFEEAVKIIHSLNYELLANGTFNKSKLKIEIRKAKGKVKKYLEYYDRIQDVKQFESSNGNIAKLEKTIEHQVLWEIFKINSNAVKQIFQKGNRLNIPTLQSKLQLLYQQARIPGAVPTKFQAKKILKIFCEINDNVRIGEERDKGVEITKFLI